MTDLALHHLALEVFILDQTWQIQCWLTHVVTAVVFVSSLTTNKTIHRIHQLNKHQSSTINTYTQKHVRTHTSAYLEKENKFQGFEN